MTQELQEVTAQVVVDELTGEMHHTHQRGTFTFDKARKMRRDTVVSLSRYVSLASVLLSQWTVEADDEWEWLRQFIEDEVLPIRSHLLGTITCGLMDFGWKAFEKVFEFRESMEYSSLDEYGDAVPATLLCLDRVRPLKNDYTWARYNKWTGRFVGLSHMDMYSGQKLFIDAPHSLFINFDEEGLGEYGEPDMAVVEPHYDSWEDCNNAAKRYDRKVAGAFLTVKYKVGKTLYNGVLTDNAKIAMDAIKAMQSVGAVAIPMEEDRMNAGGAKELNEMWKFEFLGAPQVQANFVERLMYLDKMKARSFKVTERSVFEGEFGTKADAESHADAMLMVHHLRHTRIVERLNWYLVNQLCVANAGPEAEGAVRIVAHELSDKNRALFLQIFQALLSDPGKGVEMIEKIDGDEVMKTLEIPLAENNELNMMPDPTEQGADWRDDIFVGTGVTDQQQTLPQTPPWWAPDVQFSQEPGEYALFDQLASGYNGVDLAFCPGEGPKDNSCSSHEGGGSSMVPSDRASKMRDRMIEKIKAADSRVGDWGPGGYDTERCSVTTPSGNEYTAKVRGTKVWGNHPDFQFEDHNGSMMIEGQGEAFSVFTGMANAFMRYVKEKQPQTMTFSGSGPSRAKVYTRFAKMLKHLLPHNYKVYASKHNEYLDGSYAAFKIERK